MKIRWEFVPVVGFGWTIVKHWQATSAHHKNPTWEMYEATWVAFDKFHVALATTFIPVFLAIGIIPIVMNLK